MSMNKNVVSTDLSFYKTSAEATNIFNNLKSIWAEEDNYESLLHFCDKYCLTKRRNYLRKRFL